MRLTDTHSTVIALINRSTDLGDGWRSVSDYLWPEVVRWTKEGEELFELGKSQTIRLTEEGRIVAKWLV